MGLQERRARHTIREYHVWAAMRHVTKDDIIFHEHVTKFGVRLLDESFRSQYLRISITADPCDYGWPVKRPRLFSALIRLDTFVWLGPAALQVPLDFYNIFGCLAIASPDVFYAADDEVVMQAASRMAKRRGISVAGATPNELDWRTLLTFSKLEFLEMYERIAVDTSALDGSCIYDLQQNPQCRKGFCKPIIPTLLTHGTVWSRRRRRWLLGHEKLLVQGIAAIPGLSAVPFIKTASEAQLSKLAGNSMHVAMMTYWILYILANVRRRSLLEQLPRSLDLHTDDADSEFEFG